MLNLKDGLILFTIWGHGAIARSFRAIFFSQFFNAIEFFFIMMCIAYYPWTFFVFLIGIPLFYLVGPRIVNYFQKKEDALREARYMEEKAAECYKVKLDP